MLSNQFLPLCKSAPCEYILCVYTDCVLFDLPSMRHCSYCCTGGRCSPVITGSRLPRSQLKPRVNPTSSLTIALLLSYFPCLPAILINRRHLISPGCITRETVGKVVIRLIILTLIPQASLKLSCGASLVFNRIAITPGSRG